MKKQSDLEQCHKLQKALIAHMLERERLSKKIRRVLKCEVGLYFHKNDGWVYELVSRRVDELEQEAIQRACAS